MARHLWNKNGPKSDDASGYPMNILLLTTTYSQSEMNNVVIVALLLMLGFGFVGWILGIHKGISDERSERGKRKYPSPAIASRQRHAVMFGQVAGRN